MNPRLAVAVWLACGAVAALLEAWAMAAGESDKSEEARILARRAPLQLVAVFLFVAASGPIALWILVAAAQWKRIGELIRNWWSPPVVLAGTPLPPILEMLATCTHQPYAGFRGLGRWCQCCGAVRVNRVWKRPIWAQNAYDLLQTGHDAGHRALELRGAGAGLAVRQARAGGV